MPAAFSDPAVNRPSSLMVPMAGSAVQATSLLSIATGRFHQVPVEDIDKLITRIYEDMVLGNLSQERYQKMLEGYEAEQAALNNEVIGLEDWVATREEMEDNVDQFLALLEKYVDIPELTPTIVNEFVKQIIVYAPDKSSGKRTQKVKIVFNFLEEVEVPEISEPVITQTTYGRRKTA